MLYSGQISNHIFEVSIGIGTAVLISFVTYRVFRDPKKKVSRIIDMMDVFNKGTVHIRNRDYVEDIVSQLIKDGASKLHVVADFDHTITRTHLNGVKCPSTYAVLDSSSYVSDEYKSQSIALLNHYHPIEVDPHLTIEQKTPSMLEWYTKSANLLSTSGVKKNNIPDIVSGTNIVLRDGTHCVFESLYKHNVPLLIFSAGVGDILKETLKQNNILYPNIKIIANFLNFDEKDQLTGFKGNLIHTFSKSQCSLDNQEYFDQLKSRRNVILLGDSLGDLDMTNGIKDANFILKIGFLNFKIEENMNKYLDAYDIVLANDPTMEIVTGLLQNIL